MGITTLSRTFAVADVCQATEPLTELPYHEAVAEFLGGPVESCSRYHGKLIAEVGAHPLIATLHEAFRGHRPVVLSPDIIWLTICQGFAYHVNANAESVRSRLVKHEGRPKLIVVRNDFQKGSPENPWPEVFAEFSAKIREHVGDSQSLVLADFSTTGPVERAASEVVLLDVMQAFFAYEVHTRCGIPSVTLEGTPDDWRRIALRVREFRRFDLEWWIDPLEPVLHEFVAAAEGRVNRPYWDSIYKWQGPKGSGSAHISGWVLKFFPYLVASQAKYGRRLGREIAGPWLERNPWMSVCPTHEGPGRDDIPSLPAKAPFLWKYFGTDYEMEFVGGLVGVSQNPTTLALRPEIGWAVRAASTDRTRG